MSIPIDNLANLRSVIEQLEGCIRERDTLLQAFLKSSGELRLAEEGLANYHQEALRLHEQIAVHQGERTNYQQEAQRMNTEIHRLRDEVERKHDPRMWSVDEILAHLDALAQRCYDEDWCSMAPTELSYCATRRAVDELKQRLQVPQTEKQT